MPIDLTALATLVSWTSGSVGVALLAAASVDEHPDAIRWVAGALLLLLGFWLRDWKAKREAFEKMISDKVSGHHDAIIKLQDTAERVTRELQQFSQDSRRLHRWLYSVFPPDDRQLERDRRRSASLAPPPEDSDKDQDKDKE